MAALAVGALAGCASMSPQTSRIDYACEQGEDISVVFKDREARLLRGDMRPVILSGSHTHAGFRFQSPTHSIVGKGRNLTLTVGRAVPIQCRETRRRSA